MKHSPVTVEGNLNYKGYHELRLELGLRAGELLDPDFDKWPDDKRELAIGLRDHDRAHGYSDETTNTLGDRWHSLQTFGGVR